jgi:hypothetical protein
MTHKLNPDAGAPAAMPATSGRKQDGNSGKWQPGRSGNPGGRKPGSGQAGKLRDAIAKDLPAILKSLTAAAKDGDVGAARLLLDRALPALKPIEETVSVDLSGATLTDQGREALKAIADGQLAPGQGVALLAAIGALAKLVETDEMMRRIEALEKMNAKKP